MCQQRKRREDARGILPYRCSNTKEGNIGHCCNCSTNQIESYANVDANRQSKRYGYVRIRYLFSSHEREQRRRRNQTKSQGVQVENYSSKQTRECSGSDSDFNSPAIILLKRQRSTGLGRAGAMDCLRRCIVISGRRPGLGAMVGVVDVLVL